MPYVNNLGITEWKVVWRCRWFYINTNINTVSVSCSYMSDFRSWIPSFIKPYSKKKTYLFFLLDNCLWNTHSNIKLSAYYPEVQFLHLSAVRAPFFFPRCWETVVNDFLRLGQEVFFHLATLYYCFSFTEQFHS